MTLSIFVSSFFVISIEKDWWGGYLGSDKNSTQAKNFNEWLLNGKKLTKPNPVYLLENMLRLIVMGTSISFFTLITFLEIV